MEYVCICLLLLAQNTKGSSCCIRSSILLSGVSDFGSKSCFDETTTLKPISVLYLNPLVLFVSLSFQRLSIYLQYVLNDVELQTLFDR